MALRLPSFVKRTEPGFWVSAAVHGAILAAALAAFAAPPMPQAEEGIPVEVMTENQFTEMTKGQRDGAKPTPEAKPRVDRVADTIEQKDPGEAKQNVPSPPQRPPEMKTAEVEEPPPPLPPLRPALEQPQSVSVPVKPDPALEAKQQEAARAEAEKKAAERAERAAEANAQAQAEKAQAEKAEAKAREAAAREKAKLVEKQEAEAEARAEAKAEEARAKAEQAKAEAKRAAEAKAKAEEAKRVAEAKAQEIKAKEAKERAEAEARAEMQRKVAEAEAKAQAEAKAAEKAAEAKAKAEAKRVADAKAAAAAKARADAEAKARAKAELAAKFDAGAIGALVSQKPSQSTGSTGREVQRVASLGTETGASQKLSPSQRDALVGILQAQIEKCYAAPPGAESGIVLPVLDIRLNPDGSFSADPRLMRGGASAVDTAIAQAALRAVRRCAPYRIPAQFAPSYSEWKNIVATFDLPRT